MEVEISALLPEDIDGVAAVHVQAWQAAYPGIMSDEFLGNLSTEMAADYWRHVAWRRDGNAFVARCDGHIAGFTAVGEHRKPGTDAGELYGLNVAPEYWGTGVATELLHRAERRLLQLGFSDVVLYVASENDRGRRFYEREGWTDDGVDEVEDFGGRPVEERRYSRRL